MIEKVNQKRKTFNVLCYLKKTNVLKNGEMPVYMRVTVNKQSAVLSIQATVNPANWSQAKEKSRAKDKTSVEVLKNRFPIFP